MQLRRLLRTLGALACLMLAVVSAAPPALAHAELRQSSPAAGETVGGELHSVALQFFDLDIFAPQDAKIFDAAGNELAGQTNREDQRLVIALIDPIETPGDYLVTYAVNGIDGDFSEESFSFTWQEGAPEPAGITLGLIEDAGFDLTNFALLLVGAGLAAFLLQRFLFAYKEHRNARSGATPDARPEQW